MRIKKATIKEDENAAECVCAIDGRPIVQGPQFSGPYHQLLFHVTRRAQELVLPDAAFREMRQARWSPQDSNSFRKPACCPSLDYLADQLILRQTHGDAVESWTTLSAALTDRMAV